MTDHRAASGASAAEEALSAAFRWIDKRDPDRSRIAGVLRATFDQLYDGQRTGRYKWDQLFKTEKTHYGTLLEINLQREFCFDDGRAMDYQIAGVEVDCKYSQNDGGWMVPSEALGHVLFVVTASDVKGEWSAGLVRVTTDRLNLGRNRDRKATLNKLGRQSIQWLGRNLPLPPNVLLNLSEEDLTAIFAQKSGTARVSELFRCAAGRRVGRGVIATVAQQHDFMKRVRGNGGARDVLRAEGIVVLGDSTPHRELAAKWDIQIPRPGESVSVRIVPAESEWHGPFATLNGQRWRPARESDPVVDAPTLPDPRRRHSML